MPFIRYRWKSEKDFKLFPCNGIGCSVSDLKQFLMGKSSKSSLRRVKDQIDFVIIDVSTNEEYRNDIDLITCNSSIIVARQLRETFEPLTPETNQHQRVSLDDINGYLLFDRSSKTANNSISYETTRIKVNSEKSLHETTMKPTFYVCYHCKQCGHIKRHCPLLTVSSTAKMHGTIDLPYRSAINVVPSASISSSGLPHSCLVKNKDTIICDVNKIDVGELLFNESQSSIDTHQAVSVCPSSSFSYSNISLRRPSSNSINDPLSKNHGAKLSQIRSTQRFSPYRPPYSRMGRRPVPKTTASISGDHLFTVPREVLAVSRSRNDDFSDCLIDRELIVDTSKKTTGRKTADFNQTDSYVS